MKFYIDCEWNSYKGELISIALVSEQGHTFYEVLKLPEEVDPWVMDNVIPVLDKRPVPLTRAQFNLQEFLASVGSVHIIADWPEDVARFCDFIITGPGKRLDTPPLTFEVVRVDSESAMPHNALADAKGLKAHCEAMLANQKSTPSKPQTQQTSEPNEPHNVGTPALTAESAELIDAIENQGLELYSLIGRLQDSQARKSDRPEVSGEAYRWISIGKTHLQQGLMALLHAVLKPDKF